MSSALDLSDFKCRLIEFFVQISNHTLQEEHLSFSLLHFTKDGSKSTIFHSILAIADDFQVCSSRSEPTNGHPQDTLYWQVSRARIKISDRGDFLSGTNDRYANFLELLPVSVILACISLQERDVLLLSLALPSQKLNAKNSGISTFSCRILRWRHSQIDFISRILFSKGSTNMRSLFIFTIMPPISPYT
ncbi:uncharacterized protein [Euphorbia lathyris]|uniref:uncharacterized protein isoform X1 n=1 Tax=Euphorbia lathyris TaxID=212925 RepID=UPI0033134E00